MGHNTYNSLPHGGPLPDRINIVLSRDPHLQVGAAAVCTSLGGLMEAIKSYDTDDVFIIGGQALYEQLQPYCHRAFITHIDSHSQADRHFFHIHKCANWKEIKRSDDKECNGIKYTFAEYVNADVKTIEGSCSAFV